jgi:hypothetical protein
MRAARPINQEQISFLEDMRKNNPNYSYDDLIRDSDHLKSLHPVTLT